MKQRRWTHMVAIAVACALVGGAAGIAGSSAAPSHKASAKSRSAQGPGGRPFGRMRRGGPPVHSEAIVPNQAGDGFETVTMDNGTFKSLSGNDLSITEGTKTVKYKDVTITIPDGATVRRNFADAKLGDLQDGDHVSVVQSARGTFVMAVDDQHQGQRPDGRDGPGPDGPGGPGMPPPPPPGG